MPKATKKLASMKPMGSVQEDSPAPAPGRIVILAGGQSRRFGRDKSRFQWKGRTFVQHVRASALATGLPVSVVRQDRHPGCGPLGGMDTAFQRFRAPWILFLACDMPLVPPRYLKKLVLLGRDPQARTHPIITTVTRGKTGFPMVLRREVVPELEKRLRARDFSLQDLFKAVPTKRLHPPKDLLPQLINVNHGDDLPRLEGR